MEGRVARRIIGRTVGHHALAGPREGHPAGALQEVPTDQPPASQTKLNSTSNGCRLTGVGRDRSLRRQVVAPSLPWPLLPLAKTMSPGGILKNQLS